MDIAYQNLSLSYTQRVDMEKYNLLRVFWKSRMFIVNEYIARE